MTTHSAQLAPVKALVFDIVGTTTDWFTSVHAAVKAVDSKIDAEELVKSWRSGIARRTALSNAEGKFVEMYTAYEEVLDYLCRERGLEWTEDVKRELVKSWGRMKAWEDTAHGLKLLRSKYVVCGLTNCRASMMIDVVRMAHKKNNMVFDLLLTSDVIRAYKPAPKMYQAALSVLNLQPSEVALVAAHAYDLRAAREHNFRTIYVARDSELALEPPEELEKRTKDFDLHVEGGLIHLARALGIEDDEAELL